MVIARLTHFDREADGDGGPDSIAFLQPVGLPVLRHLALIYP